MFNDIKDHYGALRCELEWEDPIESTRPGFARTLRSWAHARIAATEVARRMFATFMCRMRGHDYQPDGCDYVESGGEGFSCSRCGIGFTAWH